MSRIDFLSHAERTDREHGYPCQQWASHYRQRFTPEVKILNSVVSAGLLRFWSCHRIFEVSFSSGRYCSYLSTDEVGGEVKENQRN